MRTTRRQALTAFVLLTAKASWAASLMVGATKNVPLDVPPPRTFKGQFTEDDVLHNIVEIAERLHWRILCQTTPGKIRMVYLRGDRLELDIEVHYTAHSLALQYLGSRGLYEEKHDDGTIWLRHKGNVLMSDLDRVLGRRFGLGLPAPTPGEDDGHDAHDKAPAKPDDAHAKADPKRDAHGHH